MARVKVIYADGRVESYISSAVFRRARQGDVQAIFYSEYIRSRKWNERRGQHLAMFPNCRGCGKPAVLVHHRTYETLGHEPTKHLLSLCDGCHARIHGAVNAKERRLRRVGKLEQEMDNNRLYSITNYMIREIRKEYARHANS